MKVTALVMVVLSGIEIFGEPFLIGSPREPFEAWMFWMSTAFHLGGIACFGRLLEWW